MSNTREKLIELLGAATFGVNKQTIPSYLPNAAIGDVADHLIANGVTVQKWIPVSERLPEKSGDYLGYCGDGYIGLLPYSTQYKLFNTFDGCGTKHAMAVTHWMPLPEPPKGE